MFSRSNSGAPDYTEPASKLKTNACAVVNLKQNVTLMSSKPKALINYGHVILVS